MAKKKKRKQQKPPENPLLRFARRNQKLLRNSGIAAALIGVVVAVIFVADPFGGTPTAIDENGLEVNAGLLNDRSDTGNRPGSVAPNFLLPDYDELAVRLDSFEGKAVFLNFWASWCGPCEREMPEIIKIAERFPDDVVVLAVNRGESKGTATSWTRDRNFPEDLPNFHWLLDPREDVFRAYRQGSGMPQSLFLDGASVIRRDIRRAMEFEEMEAAVEQTLGFIDASASTD